MKAYKTITQVYKVSIKLIRKKFVLEIKQKNKQVIEHTIVFKKKAKYFLCIICIFQMSHIKAIKR